MDVLSDVTGDVLFKIENSANTSIASEVSAAYTTANEWQTLEYVFPDTLDAGVFNQLVLFFNFGTTDATTWYFDNVTGPDVEFGGDVDVNLIVDDKLGVASSVSLDIAGDVVDLTETDDIWTGMKTLSPYKITTGGGDYETIVIVDGANVDTVTISVSGGVETLDWNYLLIQETPEDGTANAISVGDTPPVIDGVIDDVWANAKVHPLQKRDWWGSPTGLYSYFKVMWDIDNVYVLNYVDDATPTNDGGNPWENDNVELFFDMNQSATTPFDSDDWQIRCIRGLDTWTGSANVNDTWAADLSRAQAEHADGDGYVMEWAIPWTSLSSAFLPLATFEFNFDVVVADVADGIGRDYIIAWNTTADINYQNTELFGTITLSDETSEVSVQSMLIPNLAIYPNPVVDQLNITADVAIDQVNVFDITGREVSTITSINESTVTIDVSVLRSNAIYIVKITDVDGNTTARKVTVQ
jgi:hypothetical protein